MCGALRVGGVHPGPGVADLNGGGVTPAASGTPAEFGAFIRAENEKWGRVAKTANIKLD